ncbi:hypothetical protein BJ165DRAFT_1528637 [Panaeolus papilionaceus]|nr:hypothetical protein BJ165DRAFT_1528637 [Panaeolus papilionaceus]
MNPLIVRQIPTVSYTIQNIWISAASITVAFVSFFFTCFVVLPLAILKPFVRPFIDKGRMNSPDGAQLKPLDERKVVLVVGASRGIGLSVVKQYAEDPNAVVIAASHKIDKLRESIIELGDTSAMVQCAEVDLSQSKKHLCEAIRALDKQYGPITHLYEVGAVVNTLKDSTPYNLDVATEMIQINVSGTTTAVLTMYELMKYRGYGKICIVGSIVGSTGPANQISYAATKAYINSFSSSLRVLAAPFGVAVVNIQPCFIDTRMTQKMRSQGSTIPDRGFGSPDIMARKMIKAVEGGGVGMVTWPSKQGIALYALRALNPITDEFGKWASMKAGISGKKVT